MHDFAAARRMMVDGQIRPSDVTDLRVIAAFLDVPRERFAPPRQAPLAYLDFDLPLREGPAARCLIKPMVLAKLIQAAAPGEGDRVLDVGAATGYSSAILSRLCGSVVSLEEDAALVREGAPALQEAAVAPVTGVVGPLAAGAPGQAPYDVILVNGAVEDLPPALCAQLKDGGRLVCVRGAGVAGKAMLYLKDGDEMSGRPLFDATAPLLPGFAKVPVFVF